MQFMNNNRRDSRPISAILLVAAFALGFSLMCQFLQADDGLIRLRNNSNQPTAAPSSRRMATPPAGSATKLNPADANPAPTNQENSLRLVGHFQDFSQPVPSLGFPARGDACEVPSEILPLPLAYGTVIFDPEQQPNPWNPNSRKDEYVFDGGDREKAVSVDASWNVYGLDSEDTIGHFDTLDGRRLATASNRVAIYAPRFGAVRKVDGLINAETRLKVGELEERTQLARSDSRDFSTTTKQHLAVDRFEGADRASGLMDRNRGVVQENVTHLFGTRNHFEAFENLSLIRIGKHANAEIARLGLGLQSANVWQDNLGLQVAVEGAQPVIVNDVYRVQQLVTIESDDKTAILRVTKVASKISARSGEPVDFTIRFDNLTGKRIGNVTIIDNLTGRLEYVPDSAECSLQSEFIQKENENGSLMLRWEITDPLPANSGGLIRFRCRVR